MNIPLPESNNNDIYDLGFDRSLNRELNQNSTGVVYDAVGEASNAAQVLSGGNLNLKTLTIGGLTRQVAPGDDIQAAIDAVSREGGGTVQLLADTYELFNNIRMKSNVTLRGQGQETTILNFGGRPYGIVVSSATRFEISSLSIYESSAAAIIDIAADPASIDSDFFTLSDLYIFTDNVITTTIGVRIGDNCSDYVLNKVFVQDIPSTGFDLRGVTGARIESCRASSCLSYGFYVNTSGSERFSFVNCSTRSCTNNAFHVANASYGNFVNCTDEGSLHGFYMETGASYVNLVSCIAFNQGKNGFVHYGKGVLTNCTVLHTIADSGYDFGSSDSQIIAVANLMTSGVVTSKYATISEMYGGSTMEHRQKRKMKNTSGAGLRSGNVVILKSVAAGDEITTTTTNGSNKVFGVVHETIDNNATGGVFTEGSTTDLYVANGTASITIGDWLSTYSHAYYAKRATTGDMAFAIALATPSTGTASIAALLMSPRLI